MTNEDELRDALRLPPTLNTLMWMLLVHRTVSMRLIKDGLNSSPKVAIYRLRHRLQGLVTIHSHRRNGYWINEADKEKIHMLIGEVTNDTH